MPSRFWGLSRRATVLAVTGAVLVGLVVALVMGGGGDSEGEGGGRVARARAGAPAAPHAVWVFGFETLRLDRALRGARRLDATGFGAVLGRDGRVWMYDAGSGRVGVLDATRNRIEDLGALPPGTPSPNAFAPTVAVDAGTLWLVPAPGRIVAFDPSRRRAGEPIAVGPGTSGAAPVATGVAAASGVVVAATPDATGIALARVDPATGTVVAEGHVDVAGAVTLDGLATDGTSIWVVAADTAYDVDAATLAVARPIALGDRAGGARGAVLAGGALWVLADHGAALARVDSGTGTVTRALRILAAPPARWRVPASLVSDGARVYAMVQSGIDAADHAVRIVGYDTGRRRPTRAVDLPSEIFAGALAVS